MGLKSFGSVSDGSDKLTQIEIESVLRTLKNSKVVGFEITDIEPLYNAINKLKSQREKIIEERNKK